MQKELYAYIYHFASKIRYARNVDNIFKIGVPYIPASMYLITLQNCQTWWIENDKPYSLTLAADFQLLLLLPDRQKSMGGEVGYILYHHFMQIFPSTFTFSHRKYYFKGPSFPYPTLIFKQVSAADCYRYLSWNIHLNNMRTNPCKTNLLNNVKIFKNYYLLCLIHLFFAIWHTVLDEPTE